MSEAKVVETIQQHVGYFCRTCKKMTKLEIKNLPGKFFVSIFDEPREPLDAKLIKYEWNDAPADLFVEFSKRFDTEQEAIAFCAKHGLRINGESVHGEKIAPEIEVEFL